MFGKKIRRWRNNILNFYDHLNIHFKRKYLFYLLKLTFQNDSKHKIIPRRRSALWKSSKKTSAWNFRFFFSLREYNHWPFRAERKWIFGKSRYKLFAALEIQRLQNTLNLLRILSMFFQKNRVWWASHSVVFVSCPLEPHGATLWHPRSGYHGVKGYILFMTYSISLIFTF